MFGKGGDRIEETMSEDAISEEDKELNAFLDKLRAFMAHETEDCIQCGKHVTRLQKVGRCVYAVPCGCRLWQGNIPEAWRKL